MIYVASPYTHKDKEVMQQRYEAVSRFCALKVREGYLVYSPIAHWHPIAEKYNLPKNDAWWRVLDEDVIKASKQLWVLTLDGWGTSSGVTREIAFAKYVAVRVKYFDEGGLECTT